MHLETKKAHLLLGTNLGEREANLQQALILIESRVGEVKKRSSVYETAAWGKVDQPGFLNMAVEVNTNLNPLSLLHTVLEIEKSLGRVRLEKWGSRLIDIDIILFGDQIVHLENELEIPHPEMQNRRFVMEPITEIAADLMHPILHQRMADILRELVDDLSVKRLQIQI